MAGGVGRVMDLVTWSQTQTILIMTITMVHHQPQPPNNALDCLPPRPGNCAGNIRNIVPCLKWMIITSNKCGGVSAIFCVIHDTHLNCSYFYTHKEIIIENKQAMKACNLTLK